MSRTKKIIRGSIILVVGVVVLFGGFLGYMTLMDYKPEPIEDVFVKGNGIAWESKDTLSVLSWNVGYCGLGKEQDFFFDGGKNVRPEKQLYENYQGSILYAVESFRKMDFLMFQEVDRNSKRSYYTDQVELMAGRLSTYAFGFAINYHSRFVPQPVTDPYGKVFGGLVTFSKYKPEAARRHALAADAAWPVGLFMLKRCFMELRYPVKNGKDLVLVNLHLSAYDDGTVKQRQMDTLKNFLLAEAAKGNYVIAGGDWNQFPPGYVPEKRGKLGIAEISVEENYPAAGWKWGFSTLIPTNRSLEKPYDKATTQMLVIDFFLVSPNVQVLRVDNLDLDFQNSDHNPVKGIFVLE